MTARAAAASVYLSVSYGRGDCCWRSDRPLAPHCEQTQTERRRPVKITVKRVEAIKATRIHLTDNCAA
jgi:hypothetical protein